MPTIGERAACQRCGQEVEWVGEWWDRGSDTCCGPHDANPGEDYTRKHVVREMDISHLYVKRDTMHDKYWRLAWMVPGETTYCYSEGECSAVYHRTRWLAVAYGKRVYGEVAKNWPRR